LRKPRLGTNRPRACGPSAERKTQPDKTRDLRAPDVAREALHPSRARRRKGRGGDGPTGHSDLRDTTSRGAAAERKSRDVNALLTWGQACDVLRSGIITWFRAWVRGTNDRASAGHAPPGNLWPSRKWDWSPINSPPLDPRLAIVPIPGRVLYTASLTPCASSGGSQTGIKTTQPKR